MAFASISRPLIAGNNIMDLEANGSVSPGMVVAFAAAGASEEVGAIAVNASSNAIFPIGVAMYGAKDGDALAVAGTGCICTVMADGAIDAGDWVIGTNLSNAGAVVQLTPRPNTSVNNISLDGLDSNFRTTIHAVIGQAREDISAGSTGTIFVMPFIYSEGNLSSA